MSVCTWQTASEQPGCTSRWRVTGTMLRESCGRFSSGTLGGCSRSEVFLLNGDIDQSLGRAAQGAVFTEDQRQVATDLGVREADRAERISSDVFLDVRACNETHANIGGDEALQQFAGIQLHGIARLQLAVVEEGIEGVARVAGFRDDQRILSNLIDSDLLFRSQWMPGRRNHDE